MRSGTFLISAVLLLTLAAGVFFFNLEGRRTSSSVRWSAASNLETEEPSRAPAQEVKQEVREFASALERMVPVTTADPSGGSFNRPREVLLRCVHGVKCVEIVYTLDGTEPDFNGHGIRVTADSVRVTVGEGVDGPITLKYRGRASSGSPEAIKTASFNIDSTPPITNPSANTGSYDSALTLTISCSDNASGCQAISYSINGEDPDFVGHGTVENSASATFSVGDAGPGSYVVKYRARDAAGNEELMKAALYEIAMPCMGGMISDTGLSPCLRTCGERPFETTEAAAEHTQCLCQSGYFWNHDVRACEPHGTSRRGNF